MSQLANDSDYVTQTEMTDAIADAVTGGTVDLTGYQKSRDINLTTIDKTVVGAINELKDSIDNFEGGTGEGLTNDKFALRAGYHHESQSKGNRKYFTVGAGFKMNVFSLDAAAQDSSLT